MTLSHRSPLLLSIAALALSVVGAPRLGRADGIKLDGVTLRAATDGPRAALVVDAMRSAKGDRISARVVGHIAAWGRARPRPPAHGKHAKHAPAALDPNRAYVLRRRYTFKVYREPESRAGKWVLATRYWNACWLSTPPTVILAYTDLGYFELFCRTPSNVRKLSILQSPAAVQRYRKMEKVQALRRDLTDPDLFIEALAALQARRQLRVDDVLRAASKMNRGSNADPLEAYARLLKKKARLRYWQDLLQRLSPQSADYVRRVFERREASRPLVPLALALYARLPYRQAATAEMVCNQLWPIARGLKGKMDEASRRGIRKLLAYKVGVGALSKACKETIDQLRKLAR